MKHLLIALALTAPCKAATVATIGVWAGGVSGNPADTFTRLSAGGGFATGTRIGLASAVSAAREIAGTSNAVVWTLTGAGTITVTYYLDNTVNAPFRPGIQGLYDASGGLATTAAGVNAALGAFNSLSGVTATTVPNPYPASLDTGTGGAGAPAELFTTTYVIAPGSPAIGMDLAIGFHSAWNNTGGYIFGSESFANDVVIDFVAIPEPAAALLGGIGALALLRRRR